MRKCYPCEDEPSMKRIVRFSFALLMSGLWTWQVFTPPKPPGSPVRFVPTSC